MKSSLTFKILNRTAGLGIRYYGNERVYQRSMAKTTIRPVCLCPVVLYKIARLYTNRIISHPDVAHFRLCVCRLGFGHIRERVTRIRSCVQVLI